MWIIMAWRCISPEVTVKGFNKCCISNAKDGTNDDTLWNDMEGMGMLGVSVRKNEDSDCEDGDSDTDW
jgi:hypothetical protein